MHKRRKITLTNNMNCLRMRVQKICQAEKEVLGMVASKQKQDKDEKKQNERRVSCRRRAGGHLF